tara:strand:+ start:931 stop:2049 length:1119 start_codon:yes stop_codon:yes gene_type:complete
MSWLEIPTDTDFSLANIPFGIYSLEDTTPSPPHIATRIGDIIVDIHSLQKTGLLSSLSFDTTVLLDESLNRFMGLNRTIWRETRLHLISLFSSGGNGDLQMASDQIKSECLIPMSKFKIRMHLPAIIGDYTDFYSSREHATNVGTMFRGKDNALQPNWLHLPVGYHGRSSSVVISGTDVRRPRGQLQVDKADPSKGSLFDACKLLDFELEMAVFVGGEDNPMGQPINMDQADDRIFGLVLMNDWSARDIQAWEYVPLGPFTAKNFATSISPWIITLDALEPFRCSSSAGPIQSDPTPLSYITDPAYATGAFDVKLEVAIKPQGEKTSSVITTSNLRNMYWNIRQQLVHHSITGCPMKAGDLLGTGNNICIST